MDLFKHLVDVDGEGLNSSSSGFLVSGFSGGGSLGHLYCLNIIYKIPQYILNLILILSVPHAKLNIIGYSFYT